MYAGRFSIILYGFVNLSLKDKNKKPHNKHTPLFVRVTIHIYIDILPYNINRNIGKLWELIAPPLKNSVKSRVQIYYVKKIGTAITFWTSFVKTAFIKTTLSKEWSQNNMKIAFDFIRRITYNISKNNAICNTLLWTHYSIFHDILRSIIE